MKKSLKTSQEKPFSSRLSITTNNDRDRYRISGKAYIGFTKRAERVKPLKEKNNEKIIS